MKITSEQLAILESLECQRLSSDINNMYLVESFYNDTNETIAQTLKNEAFGEDGSNCVAYYVVKHPNGQILFFFSLKCGLLFDHFIRPSSTERNYHFLVFCSPKGFGSFEICRLPVYVPFCGG